MGELQRYARDGGVGTAPCAADMRSRHRAPGTLLRRAIPGSNAQSLDPMPALAGERDWLLARLADTPNVTCPSSSRSAHQSFQCLDADAAHAERLAEPDRKST